MGQGLGLFQTTNYKQQALKGYNQAGQSYGSIINLKQKDESLESAEEAQKKTAGGGLMAAGGGAASGAMAGAQMGGSTGGYWGAGIGAVLGGLAYALG